MDYPNTEDEYSKSLWDTNSESSDKDDQCKNLFQFLSIYNTEVKTRKTQIK